MNSVNLLGNICNDLELQTTAAGKGILKFRLAVRRDKENTDFINCVAFSKTAELLAEYTTKGTQIGITGSIWTGSYAKDDGSKVYTTDVVVRQVYFTSGGNGEKGDGRQRNAKEEEDLEDFPF